MTDKQIMIDGVNVLNCGHYSQFEGETENACYIMQKTFIGKEEISKEYCSCETNFNCYYKQLKRKEQELKLAENHIKDLNLMVHNGEERVSEIEQKLKRKEQEFEQYKKSKQASYETMQIEWNEAKNEVKKYKKLAEDFENDFYNSLSDKESNLLKKYKQALEEIREIQKDCEGCEGDCCYCYSGSGWIFKLSDEVLKGNFEVLDE